MHDVLTNVTNPTMAKKKTQEEFLDKAFKAHEDKYDYSKVDYVNNRSKVTIICPEHGEFEQIAGHHVQGNGCPTCGGTKKLDNNSFIEKCKIIHEDKYDYSKVDYVNNKIKVTIICPEHGEFEQIPKSHIRGQGCPACGGSEKSDSNSFIEKCKIIHEDKYDYSKVDYVNNKIKVTIICPEHGEFEQIAGHHMRGIGCSACGGTEKLDSNSFIEKSKEVHEDKYDYSKVDYVNNRSKVTIICPEHGEFEQTAGHHIQGNGCPICNESKGEKEIRKYLEKNNIPFKPQYRFKKSTISKSKFDFAISKGLIEYQGKPYYCPCSFGSKKEYGGILNLLNIIKRDLKKKQWCKKHNIPMLEIPYWDKDRIPEILDAFLSDNKVVISKPPEIVRKHELMRSKILERIIEIKKNE